MEYFKSLPWEIWLHASGVILWCATIAYVVKHRTRKRESAPEERFSGDVQGFRDEVYFQLLKQQAEKALERLSGAITEEQHLLRQLIANRTTEGQDRALLEHPSRHEAREPVGPPSTDNHDPYGEVARLVELGVGEREISRRVDIPRSQISLIAKLKKCSQTSPGE
ncbi:MAG: hypothetical protein SWQ30_00310 [Thermodesulfobacteriota bacterium]|nr:hypothetical protein [Thermodesulfobacteriota bacterium]